MKRLLRFMFRGAALGILAGGLFVVAQILNTALHQETTIRELAEFFSRLYITAGEAGFSTLDFSISILYHLMVSMLIGVLAALTIRQTTKFSSKSSTIIMSVVIGTVFWLATIQILEPKLTQSFIFQHQRGKLEQLFIQAIVFACFGWLAHSVFKDLDH